jgi:hypothetical protein
MLTNDPQIPLTRQKQITSLDHLSFMGLAGNDGHARSQFLFTNLLYHLPLFIANSYSVSASHAVD